MKKPKKHSFKYTDPAKTKSVTEAPKAIEKNTIPKEALTDFKSAGLTILVFIMLIIILYLAKDILKLEVLLKSLRF